MIFHVNFLKSNDFLTLFKTLNGNWSGVVPQSLPYFSKLTMTKFANKFETAAINFPLISCAMGQVSCHRFLHLQKNDGGVILQSSNWKGDYFKL